MTIGNLPSILPLARHVTRLIRTRANLQAILVSTEENAIGSRYDSIIHARWHFLSFSRRPFLGYRMHMRFDGFYEGGKGSAECENGFG